EVARANGAKVGRVVDVLLDGSAAPQAVVLDVSGTLEKRHTIAADWSALHFVTKNNMLEAQLDMSDQQVDASPPYAPEQPVRAVTPAVPAAPAAAAPAASAAPATSATASAAATHGAK
ncbi:MAG: PRC-barrel domain containing protein, partial [Paraburkholderia sp.]|nr:PRC-barrel domain containing protein [Paraburkholderia sp.]